MRLRRLISKVAFALLCGSAFADVDPATMPVNGWTGNVGIPGGIPSSYTLFANVKNPPYNAVGNGIADDATAINQAIADCPDGQYVYIPTGTYRCNSGLGRTGVYGFDYQSHPFSIAVKGDGPALTKILCYAAPGVDCFVFAQGGPLDDDLVITSGNTRGSTSVTVANFLGHNPAYYTQIGKWMTIVHHNADSGWTPSVGTDGQPNGGNAYQANSCSQVVRLLTATGSGPCTMTFTPALNDGFANDATNFNASMPYRCGIEGLYIEKMTDGSGSNIFIKGGDECWVKNVESAHAYNYHICLQSCSGCEVRQCYVHGIWEDQGGGNTGYGYFLFQFSCSNLIEDNIAVQCRHALPMEWGGQGNVFGYNYSKNPINEHHLTTDYLMGDVLGHGGNPRYNLWEGNVAATIRWDSVLGANEKNTAFRNRIQRTGLPATYVACFASDIQWANHYNNLIGNIYEPAPAQFNDTYRRWGSIGDSLVAPAPDAQAQATTYVNGDYDLGSGTITWDSGTPSHVLVSSYYLAAKPSWWDTPQWPDIGPDMLLKSRTQLLGGRAQWVLGSNPAYRRAVAAGY